MFVYIQSKNELHIDPIVQFKQVSWIVRAFYWNVSSVIGQWEI